MSEMKDRVASAIARVTASKAADEVLAEIAKTHVLIEEGRWQRVRKAAAGYGCFDMDLRADDVDEATP